jgi:hypothetical protein
LRVAGVDIEAICHAASDWMPEGRCWRSPRLTPIRALNTPRPLVPRTTPASEPVRCVSAAGRRRRARRPFQEVAVRRDEDAVGRASTSNRFAIIPDQIDVRWRASTSSRHRAARELATPALSRPTARWPETNG